MICRVSPLAHSASMRYGTDFPDLDPTPITKLDPRPVLESGNGIDGYVQEQKALIYYRIEPIVDPAINLWEPSCSHVMDMERSPLLNSDETEF